MLVEETVDERKMRELAGQAFIRHHDYIRYIAFRQAPLSRLAEDIVNDSYVYFAERACQWDYENDLRPLFRTIVTHIARRHWREAMKTMPETLRSIAEQIRDQIEPNNTEQDEIHAEEQLALELCKTKLSPRSRELLEIHYYSGVSIAQYANISGLNSGTLRKMLSRIRDFLRMCIEKTLKELPHEK